MDLKHRKSLFYCVKKGFFIGLFLLLGAKLWAANTEDEKVPPFEWPQSCLSRPQNLLGKNLDEDQLRVAASHHLQCIQDLILGGAALKLSQPNEKGEVPRDRVLDVYEESMKEPFPADIKLLETQILVHYLKRLRLEDVDSKLSTLVSEVHEKVGGCEVSLSYCDQWLSFLLDYSVMAPQEAIALVEKENQVVESLQLHPGIQKFYDLKFKAIWHAAFFFESSSIVVNGTTPRWIGDGQFSKLEAWITESTAIQIQLYRAMAKYTAEDLVSYVKEGGVSEEELKMQALQAAEGIHLSCYFLANYLKALEIYSGRLGKADIDPWLATMKTIPENDKYALRLMALIFVDIECFLPWRSDWFRSLSFAMEATEQEYTRKLIAMNEVIILRKLEGVDLKSLLPLEKEIATHSKLVPSLVFMADQLAERITRAFHMAIDFQKSHKATLGESADSLYRDYEADWFHLKCLEADANRLVDIQLGRRHYQHEMSIRPAKAPPFAVIIPVHKFEMPYRLCSKKMFDSVDTYENFGRHYVQTVKIRKITFEIGMTVFVQVALLPLGVGPVAQLVGKVIFPRLAAPLAARLGGELIKNAILKSAIEKGIGFSALSLSFLFAMKGALKVLFQVPFNDPNKTFMENWGYPFLYGVMIMWGLEKFSPVIQRWAFAHAKGDLFSFQWRSLFYQRGFETSSFVSLEYVSRTVDHLMHPDVEVWRGSEDFVAILGRSGLVSFGFSSRPAVALSGYLQTLELAKVHVDPASIPE